MRTNALVLAASLLVLPSALSAQQPPPIEPGVRVRVTRPEGNPGGLEGTILSIRGDTLVLQQDVRSPRARRRVSAETSIALPSITKLEVSLERKSHWLLGAVPIGLAGCLLGAGIGSGIKTERWAEVPLDRLRVSFAPRWDGFALGFKIAF